MARHWVASTSRTWLVPMPKAIAPTAPCVAVWLSPHAMVMPGWVRPSSGPITCTIPCLPLSSPKNGTPLCCALRVRWTVISSATSSANGRCCAVVGMMWSRVAKVRAGIRTGTLSSRRAWNAWGEVTSWIRWRPIRSWVCPEGSVRTVCASHTLSSSDDGIGISSVAAECAAVRPLSIVKYSSRSRKLR